MLTVQLTCPRCHRNLRCHRLIAPGERLRCPHCAGVFQAGVDDAPQSVAASNRGRGILLAWLLFANLILFAGGGIAIAVVVGNRAKPPDAETVVPALQPDRVTEVRAKGPAGEPELRIDESPAGKPDLRIDEGPDEKSDPPIVETPLPAAAPSKPAPAPEPPRKPTVDPPKPPPLPKPEQPPKEPAPPAKEKSPEPEKLQPPAAVQREEQPAHWLPPRLQKQVDHSIDNGVEFLRLRQRSDGSWGHQAEGKHKHFAPGITALSALTLLECGVPAKDAQVRSAAHYLRQRMPELTATYSIAMAILFFDRLGDEADAARIRTLALRLIAGQKPSGGWDYPCPTLDEDEELGLLALLYKDRPTTPIDLFATERSKEGKRDIELYRPRPSKAPPLELFVGEKHSPLSPATPSPRAKDDAEERKADKKEREAEKEDSLPGDIRRLSKRALEAADKLPEELRRTPALHAAELLRELPDLSAPRTDNSNTQFAILGLLTAENYDVPMERAMALIDWRFRNAMTLQGGWEYRPGASRPGANLPPASPLSMTAAALMGLALKHGLLLPNRKGRGRDVVVHDDEIIHRGFLTLTGMIASYYASFEFNPAKLNKLDLYCLWTIERVAVLYNQQTLGGPPSGLPKVEWYSAGVNLLLPLQLENGSWSPKATYCLDEPCVSSSFALLFLKRSNLARGLTERLKAPARD